MDNVEYGVFCSICGSPIHAVTDTAGTFATGLRHKVCPVEPDYDYVADEDGSPITHETFIERFGHEVPADAVPNLVRAGYEVWSYGYGQETNDDPGTFTTLDVMDLDYDEANVDYWGPFAVTPETYAAILASGPFLFPRR